MGGFIVFRGSSTNVRWWSFVDEVDADTLEGALQVAADRGAFAGPYIVFDKDAGHEGRLESPGPCVVAGLSGEQVDDRGDGEGVAE